MFTLSVQGGPMSPERAAEFESEPFYAEAVALRRWDEQAKDPTIDPVDLERFRAVLERLLRSAAG